MFPKTIIFLGIFILIASTKTVCQSPEVSCYQQELTAFKNSPEYKNIFSENHPNQILKSIYRDMENYKTLSYWQTFVHSQLLGFDTIIVTLKTMPKLYAYVESICRQHHIKTPVIFITTWNGFFNACAQKLFSSTGGIVIGQQLINEVSADALEGVIAHEIGHIKHNHVNKSLAISAASTIAAIAIVVYYFNKKSYRNPIGGVITANILSSFFSSLIIGKKFEREADAFAYKTMGKGKGLLELMQHLKDEDQKNEQALVDAEKALKKNESSITSPRLYEGLKSRLEGAKSAHKIGKWLLWLYHNTPWGAHPSPEERIATIKKHLDAQQQKA